MEAQEPCPNEDGDGGMHAYGDLCGAVPAPLLSRDGTSCGTTDELSALARLALGAELLREDEVPRYGIIAEEP
jgi:hypothetical protein